MTELQCPRCGNVIPSDSPTCPYCESSGIANETQTAENLRTPHEAFEMFASNSDVSEQAQNRIGPDANKLHEREPEYVYDQTYMRRRHEAETNNLLVLVPFNEDHIARLQEAAGPGWRIEQHPQGLPNDKLESALKRADAVIGEPDPRVLYAEGAHLKLVQMTWAGTDKYTRSGLPFPDGVPLCSAVGGFGHIISQYVVAQTLSIMQNLPGYRAQQLAGVWADRGPVASLEGANVLVFGAGDIGGHIAKRMSGFDAHVTGVCRNAAEPRPWFGRLATLEGAETLLPEADVVACCIPNTDETAHYLDERRLRLMKAEAVLVNVGRGNFVDNLALARVLAEGHLRGAALDVTDPEPLPSGHPLWHEPRCTITPHVSGGSFGRHPGTENRICDICCENLRRLNVGEPLVNRVL